MSNPTYQQLFDLTGKRALVTGAARPAGIGAAIAKGLADFGAEVIVHARNDRDTRVVDAINQEGGKASLLAQDLSLPQAGKTLIERLEAEHGAVDIVVMNASCQINGDFESMTPEQIDLQITLNLRTNIDLLQTVLPLMAQRGWGRVVNVGSVNQLWPKQTVAIYGAAKAATSNLMVSLGRQYAPHGVVLNTVAPGLVDTYPEDRAGDTHAEKSWDDYAAQLNWMGRAGQPQEVVGAALYLASPACSFMSGESLFVTGGFPN